MFSLISKATSTALYPHLIKSGKTLVDSVAKMSAQSGYDTLSVTVPKQFVYHVELNRPEKLNAMNRTMWLEIGTCFEQLDSDDNCRVIVLSGAGKLFTAGTHTVLKITCNYSISVMDRFGFPRYDETCS
jgi:1,4-dihydroxy-2-naphthoyl-CoA synthase